MLSKLPRRCDSISNLSSNKVDHRELFNVSSERLVLRINEGSLIQNSQIVKFLTINMILTLFCERQKPARTSASFHLEWTPPSLP